MLPQYRAISFAPLAAAALIAATGGFATTRDAARSGLPARRVEGYTITMQLTDTAGTANFKMKVAGDAFSLGLDDLLPLMSRGLGGDLSALSDVANMAGGASLSTLTAGSYLLAQDSATLFLVMPTVRMAMTIDAGLLSGGGRPGRGGPGGFGGAGGAAGFDPAQARNARGGRGGPPVDTSSQGGRGGRGGGGRGGGGGGGRQQFATGGPQDSTANRIFLEDLGDGDAVVGHATHRYRLRTATGVVVGASCPGGKGMSTEGQFASDIPGGAFARFFSLVPMAGGDVVTIQKKDTVPAKLPRGFPMKSVASCDTPTHDPLLTLEVIQIDPTTFDASEFVVPMGIQVLNLNQRGRRGGGGALQRRPQG